jgi:hypothetical protein
MTNVNTDFNADIVLSPMPLSSAYAAWQNGKIIAEGTAGAMRLIAAGASASKLSVFDAESNCFLSGTIDQLVGHS